jgi:acetate kinase
MLNFHMMEYPLEGLSTIVFFGGIGENNPHLLLKHVWYYNIEQV